MFGVWLRMAVDVRGDEDLAVADADHGRRAVLDDDDAVRVVGRERGHGVSPLELGHGRPHGLRERAAEMLLEQVGDDLGVGLGPEDVPLGPQPLLQVQVVFDDPVVDDDDPAGAVLVGMGVLLARTAVGGPAGVAEPGGRRDRGFGQPDFELPDLAFGPGAPDAVRPAHGDPGRIISAVLELLEPLDEDRDDVLAARCSR